MSEKEFDFESLTDDDWWEIVWNDNERFWAETDEEMEDGGRWTNIMSRVFRDVETDFCYCVSWCVGATEYQDGIEPAFQATRVYPHQVWKTVYKTKPPESS